MPDADHFVASSIKFWKNYFKQLVLVILKIPPDHICADIRNLNQAGQLAVNKERGFHDLLDPGPERSLAMEPAHHLSQPLGDSLIIILH